MVCCFMFFHLFLIYMLQQDKHLSSRANIANEIELQGWIEWMCGMRVRKGGGGWKYGEIRGVVGGD